MKNKFLFVICVFLLFLFGCKAVETPQNQEDLPSSNNPDQSVEDKKEFIGFSITSLPCTLYNTFYNNVFSEEGLEVTKMYSDGTQEICDRSEFYMVINGETEIKTGYVLDSNLLGQQEISIYLYNYSDYWAKFWINVIFQENEVPPEEYPPEEYPPEENPEVDDTLFSFFVETLPAKVVYKKGDYFSSEGIVCKAIDVYFQEYEVEPTKMTIVYEGDETYTENDISLPLPIGTHTVYVYYQNLKYYFTINVFDVQEIKDFAYINTGDSITIGGYEGTDFTDTEEGVYVPIPGYDPNAPYEKVYSTPADFEYEFIEGSTTEINITGIKDEVESKITELTIPATIDGYTVKTVTVGILDYAPEVRTFVMEEGIQGFSANENNSYSHYLGGKSKVTKMFLPSSLRITEEDYINYFCIGLHYLQELSIDFTNFDKAHYWETKQKDFLYCPNLKKITIRFSSNNDDHLNNYSIGIRNGEWLFGGTSIEEINFAFNDEEFIPSEYKNKPGISLIWEAGSFENVKTLKKVTFPENCDILIGEGAFANSSIETFVFPKNSKVCIWGIEAFKNCKNLASVIFEEGCEIETNNVSKSFEGSLWSQTVTKLDLSVWDECRLDFSNFTALQEVVVGSSKVYCNFAGCNNLTTITMNDDAIFLPYSLAETALTSVVIQGENYNDTCGGYDVRYDIDYEIESGLHPGLFTNCQNLTDLTVKNCRIPPYLFGLNGTDNSNITFNYDNISFGKYAFYKCAFLKEFDMNKVMSISNSGYQFAYCENLEKVTVWSTKIENEYTEVEGYSYGLEKGMFYNCTNLKTVISDYAIFEFPKECFYNCYNLENITLPNTTNSCKVGFNEFFGKYTYKKLTYEDDSFYGASKIAKKVLDNDLVIYNFPFAFKNATYCIDDLKLTDVSVIDFSEIAVKNLTIADVFYYIPENFALGNPYLETVTLDGDIEYAAFKDCTALNTVIIGDKTFHVVRNNSFDGCIALEKIIVPAEFYEQYITAKCWKPYRDLIISSE